LQVADPLHVNTRGAAFLAAIGLGYLRQDELTAHAPVARRYEPNPALAPLYDELFDAFVANYHKTHAIHRRLQRSHEREE
jgi:xylulokinase